MIVLLNKLRTVSPDPPHPELKRYLETTGFEALALNIYINLCVFLAIRSGGRRCRLICVVVRICKTVRVVPVVRVHG